jgi:hypothetical protein
LSQKIKRRKGRKRRKEEKETLEISFPFAPQIPLATFCNLFVA